MQPASASPNRAIVTLRPSGFINKLLFPTQLHNTVSSQCGHSSAQSCCVASAEIGLKICGWSLAVRHRVTILPNLCFVVVFLNQTVLQEWFFFKFLFYKQNSKHSARYLKQKPNQKVHNLNDYLVWVRKPISNAFTKMETFVRNTHFSLLFAKKCDHIALYLSWVRILKNVNVNSSLAILNNVLGQCTNAENLLLGNNKSYNQSFSLVLKRKTSYYTKYQIRFNTIFCHNTNSLEYILTQNFCRGTHSRMEVWSFIRQTFPAGTIRSYRPAIQWYQCQVYV